MTMKYPIDQPFSLTVEEVAKLVQANTVEGITYYEAKKRSRVYGLNSYKTQKQKSLWLILLYQFKNPIVYLLIAGSLASLYFKDILETTAILAVILINALIGFFMEFQARNSMNALKKMDIVTAKVIRGGKSRSIPSEQLVPGDLIPLEAGDIIPADGRLVAVNRLQCDESSLTGESLPTDKTVETLKKDTVVGDQHNMVFKGTSVINGNGKMVVTGIAANTQLGTITSLVETSVDTITPLDKKLNRLSRKLIWVTLVMTAIFSITGFIQRKAILTIIETSIALAVAAIPEGLPIVATVALSYGMLLMARRNAIVKKLSAVETLGSTGVILTDKTGTLTENKIFTDTLAFPEETVKAQVENNLLKFPNGAVKSAENLDKLLLTGILCNNATIEEKYPEPDQLSGDPVEVALIKTAIAAGLDNHLLSKQFVRIAEVPFSSEIMMMATLHKTSSGYFTAAKGSVERLLDKCNYLQSGAHIKILDSASRKSILLQSEKMAAEGLRVLAFAYRSGNNLDTHNYLNDLVYIGMTGFLDPPRVDIKGAMLSCRKAGIRVVMITGDHPKTALNIARKVSLIDEDDKEVITGTELPRAELLTNDWRQRILAAAVFARVSPKQKLEIAHVFQQAGSIVAMTGDGVNDAPALKNADVGIAMGIRGTQVAKETASIVLKDDSFTSIVQAVAHGREIFQNIQKFVVYLVSCNLSEIFIVTVLGVIIPGATLLPLQILFLNMVTDIFPALALGLGTGDKTVMSRPPRAPGKNIITNKKWLAIALYSASITSTVVIAAVYCKEALHSDDQTCNNIAFITLTLAQLFHVFNMSSEGSGFINNEITRNKWIWIAILICSGLLLLVFALPGLRLVLGLSQLSFKLWLSATTASLLPLVVFQGYKAFQKIYSRES
ncbi:cation-transporting P-type ATPase [Mucilaginibacter rubeus]|uniref:Cation-transporting P-type ATPase n=2 Tax=Sphingobacteriaceae TaxID=84566 RepID=A0AAE6JDF0_9SPHI|nr:cation-transporting P-type ATPase [Mucilaginibacter rubeus]QEM16179.1 cation-transporting P-type ATPase [Mucilaginibacter gossypii]QEM03568.1 cation-transporting P-type ATPase [Mucilaginibacter rubeus]QTE41063.1 cation-transporting P-type ATPase [Mucilaginibacter rubeus]QTE47666.1 cation-transporting P-type ATPase [Mucilaginibacter rubeus]QTE59058.1 cation-transporting P-type ATPase [Mucilaginibacter rubeus]